MNSLSVYLPKQPQQLIQNSKFQQFQIQESNYQQTNTIIHFPYVQILKHQTVPNTVIQFPQNRFQFHQVQQHKPHPKSKFTLEEDNLLKQLVSQFGENNWYHISELMPNRNLRQCKDRWTNYLSPKINNDPWTDEEDNLLLQKFKEYGAKWVRIALSFPNRTDSNVKNRWLVLSRRSKKIENSRNTTNSTVISKAEVPLNIAKIKNEHL